MGVGNLTGDPIFLKKMKEEVILTAKIDLQVRLFAFFWPHSHNDVPQEIHNRHILAQSMSVSSSFKKEENLVTALQIRGGIKDISKIIFLISQQKHML